MILASYDASWFLAAKDMVHTHTTLFMPTWSFDELQEARDALKFTISDKARRELCRVWRSCSCVLSRPEFCKGEGCIQSSQVEPRSGYPRNPKFLGFQLVKKCFLLELLEKCVNSKNYQIVLH